ncbi:TPA: DNA-directed RNA polymerase subunit beta, partial [Patescibacteria group bacterium]|nr:DNA-directed RNA polymerase subunit beta [Candidatus Gracilibacteria bacterium]
MIPENGPWLEVNVEKAGTVVARINKSRKFPITSLLRIFGAETDDEIREYFKDTFDEEDFNYLEATLKKDTTKDALSAAEHIYNKVRPGELIDPASALDYIKNQFLNTERIFVGRIARRKINAKLGLNKPLDGDVANVYDGEDLVGSMKYLFNLSNYKKGYYIDDSDHLSNKRIRTMGEILYAHLQPVMRKFVKSIKGKLSILNSENPIKITDLVNFKIVDNAVKSFFATSQLSQFLDQINPLAEVEHKRRITALGPGGLKRETAKFEVRDVHPSHYGRICPIETPEGQNVGLIASLTTCARVNKSGFLETPFWRVLNGKVIKTGNPIYLTADVEDLYKIAPADIATNSDNYLARNVIPVRYKQDFVNVTPSEVDFIAISPIQVVSVAASLIPFFEHDDANRALMGSNMQR